MKTSALSLSKKAFLEMLAFVLLLFLSFHLVSERIIHAEFPGGDQGSWMSVAAQVARGEGFTTRWLEYPFLQHAALPRPDDFRYPGLVFPLAVSFMLFGISYTTALWTVGIIFFIFLCAIFLVCRKAFGSLTAFFAATVASISLLQLHWNTVVYSEGLFGVMTGALVLWSMAFREKNKKLFWIVLGAGCGMLYCIRPNGIFFGVGIIGLYFTERKRGCKITHLAFGLTSMAIVMLPWLVRTWYWFGSPFHLATNAGLCRDGVSDSVNLSLAQFIAHCGIWYPVKATFIGIGNFFEALHFLEHGLEILPLIGLVIGLAMRRKFFNSFVSLSFFVTFIACCYVSRVAGSWAGVRYFSPLIPFVYGYGIYVLVSLVKLPLLRRRRAVALTAIVFLGLLLIAPVFYPHKYYERTFRSKTPNDLTFAEHGQTLHRLLARNEAYIAASIAQVNFLYEYNCVGIQKFVDSTYVKELLEKNSPRLLVVTHNEFQDPRIASIMREIRRQGRELTLAQSNEYGLYWKIGE
jgi:4-amino-4-deoxy-L-arabinose transferase-like glycosyltransferase